MPIHETIVDMNPKPAQNAERSIPTRVVVTKSPLQQKSNPGQPVINNTPQPTAEPAAEGTTEESVKLSPQLSAIARKEQAFRQREQALKDREAAVATKLADAEKFEALKTKLTAKDYSEAEALGLNYEDYVKYVLEKQEGEDPKDQIIKALQARVEAIEKGSEESAASQYEETIAEYKKEIGNVVAENPDFSSIKALKKEDAVLQLIVDTFEEDGEELTVMAAAKLVEEQLINMGKAFNDLPKLKKEAEPTQRALPRPVVGKTLTNDMTTVSQKTPYKSLQYLSEAERYAEARRRVLERREKGK